MPVFKHSDLARWQTETGGRSRYRRTSADLLAIDAGIQAAIDTTTNQGYLDSLTHLEDILSHLTPDDLWAHRAAITRLWHRLEEEKAGIQSTIHARAYMETVVDSTAWLNANLPLMINPAGAFNATGETPVLRAVRRRVIEAQLKNDHGIQAGGDVHLHLIESITRQYLDPQGNWSPGQRCHFVASYCGLPGTVELREVNIEAGRAAQVDAYCSAVFHRQQGQSPNRIKHSVIVAGAGIVTDPTFGQFFGGAKAPNGGAPPIFTGTEVAFRAMF